MKRMLMGAVCLLLLAACNGNTNTPKGKVLDPDAKLSVHVRQTLRSEGAADANPNHLSPKEIVRRATHFDFTAGDNGDKGVTHYIHDDRKDIENAIIKMWGDMIIDTDPHTDKLRIPDVFIKATDVIIVESSFTEKKRDTIGYIPNRVLEEAYKVIKPAFERGDFDLVYKTFQDAYTAVPITGAEWKELKAKGEN